MSQKGVEKTDLTIKTRGGNPCFIKRKEGYKPDDREMKIASIVIDVDVRNCKKNSISSSRSTNQVICSFTCTYLRNRPFH